MLQIRGQVLGTCTPLRSSYLTSVLASRGGTWSCRFSNEGVDPTLAAKSHIFSMEVMLNGVTITRATARAPQGSTNAREDLKSCQVMKAGTDWGNATLVC